MFTYFPSNYSWSLTVSVAIDCVGTIGEMHDSISHLQASADSPPREGEEAWLAAWSSLAERVARCANNDLERGFVASAARRYFRAGIYALMGERHVDHENPGKLLAYRKGLSWFRRGLELRGDSAEFVEIPYEHSVLPAIFVPSRGRENRPCMIQFGGLDSIKEWLYPILAESFVSRGVSLLIVDQPGTGGALRLNNLPATPEVERSATAVIDYLERRSDVDGKRIGLSGVSLGGYYAPRAAAFEKRIAASIAWGGIWNMGAIYRSYLSRSDQPRSMADIFRFSRWVFGVSTDAEVLEMADRMTLAPIIDKVTCPLLVVDGSNDRQVVENVAKLTFEGAVNSVKRELKVFDAETGGVEHCQIDNIFLAADFMADWSADVLASDLRDYHKSPVVC